MKEINRKSPFFSIIIPVYKAEKFIENCVLSILKQSFEFFEIILVNDGSPDCSGELCEYLSKSDERIIVLHKENGGASTARNAGIRAAKGQYLMFVDSDDYWEGTEGLQNIYNHLKANPVDYLRMACIDEYTESLKRVKSGLGYDKTIFCLKDKNEILNRIFNSGIQPGAAWTSIIKREVVTEKSLYFVEGIKGEDIEWILNVFVSVDGINYCDECFYVYRKGRSDSVTGTADLKSVLDILSIIDMWSEKIKQPKYRDIQQSINTYLAYHLMCTVILYARLNKKDKAVAKEEIRKREHVLKKLTRIKVKGAAYIYKVLGIDLASYILNKNH